MFAPIVVFAFKRCNSLRNTINSLLANTEAADSDLYVFVDGARAHIEGEEEKVNSVREYVKTITGFRSVTTYFSDENRGLGASIIAGVTEIIKKRESVIVLEDDLILAPNFLSFMNQGLVRYKHEKEVFSVCGYSLKVSVPKEYTFDAYFNVRSGSWGWGTWLDRWMSVDWQLSDWASVKCQAKSFNHWGGSDCYKMLRGWHNGKNQSWAIRFCYSQFIQKKVSLFPIVSKVKSAGFDEEATNCKGMNPYKSDYDEAESKVFTFPETFDIDKTISKSVLAYRSFRRRAWNKLANMIHLK